MLFARWGHQMLRDVNSKPLWRHLRYPPATEINFWFSFAKSSNFLLSPISSQEKIKARYNRCPTYLRLWCLTTLCSQKLEVIFEGAPAYMNLQPSGLLCFPRGLASAPHLRDFKEERKVIFYLPLQFPSGLCCADRAALPSYAFGWGGWLSAQQSTQGYMLWLHSPWHHCWHSWRDRKVSLPDSRKITEVWVILQP